MSHISSQVAKVVAQYSASTLDLATISCFLLFQDIKLPPINTQYLKVDRLKARLVDKGYTQIYGSDYYSIFSSVDKMASIRLLLSMTATSSSPLYQLDIKNAFLHGDLAEEVYMEQPLGFVAQEESDLVCSLRHSLVGRKIILITRNMIKGSRIKNPRSK